MSNKTDSQLSRVNLEPHRPMWHYVAMLIPIPAALTQTSYVTYDMHTYIILILHLKRVRSSNMACVSVSHLTCITYLHHM